MWAGHGLAGGIVRSTPATPRAYLSASDWAPPPIVSGVACGRELSVVACGARVSEPARAPEPELEPPRAEEMAEPVGVISVGTELG